MREIDNYSSQKFTNLLSHENWEVVFSIDNINIMFNSFLDIYLKIFLSSFHIKRKTVGLCAKPWLTQGLKVSCINKIKHYQTYKQGKNSSFNEYYKKYCKILMFTIQLSKKKHFDNLIINSTNKTKITWNTVKTLTNMRNNHEKIDSMKINSKLIKDPDVIAQSFNQLFSTIAHSTINQHPSKEIVENSLLILGEVLL